MLCDCHVYHDAVIALCTVASIPRIILIIVFIITLITVHNNKPINHVLHYVHSHSHVHDHAYSLLSIQYSYHGCAYHEGTHASLVSAGTAMHLLQASSNSKALWEAWRPCLKRQLMLSVAESLHGAQG